MISAWFISWVLGVDNGLIRLNYESCFHHFFYQYLLVKKGNRFIIGPKFVKKICENKIRSLIWWARYEMRIQTGIGSRYVLPKDELKRRCLLSRNCPRVVSVVKLSKLGKKTVCQNEQKVTLQKRLSLRGHHNFAGSKLKKIV